MFLTSALPPDECAARVATALDRADRYEADMVGGKVSGRCVRLWCRYDFFNPASRIVVEGSFQALEGGTAFRGTAEYPPFITCIQVAIGLLGLFMLCVFTIAGVVGGQIPTSRLAAIPVAFAVVALIPWIGKWRARKEESYLMEFLAREMHADGGPPTTSG